MKEYWSTEPALSSSSSQKHVKSFLPSAKHLGFSGSSFSIIDTVKLGEGGITGECERKPKAFFLGFEFHFKSGKW